MSLQIFEPRYLDMIARCLKQGAGFGVVLIREGEEVGEAAQVFPVGVLAEVEDWEQQSNGMLGIKVRGSRKFRILETERHADQSLSARVDFLEDEEALPIGDHHDGLVALLEQLLAHPAIQPMNLPALDDARQLGWQLTQLLPLSRPDKVALLALDDPWLRLDHLAERIERLAAGDE